MQGAAVNRSFFTIMNICLFDIKYSVMIFALLLISFIREFDFQTPLV